MHNLFATNKMDYCRGDRPDVDCILCEVIKKSDAVVDLEVYRDELFIVCLNLFPYNPGHLLIAPLRHIEDVRELNSDEIIAMQKLLDRSLTLLESLYNPAGFNLGYNLGDASGASIKHIHQHVVPRYNRELGFIDIIGGSKIIVEDPAITKQKISKAFYSQE